MRKSLVGFVGALGAVDGQLRGGGVGRTGVTAEGPAVGDWEYDGGIGGAGEAGRDVGAGVGWAAPALTWAAPALAWAAPALTWAAPALAWAAPALAWSAPALAWAAPAVG